MLINSLEKPVILEKPNGERIPIKAEIQSNSAFMSDVNIPIEVDDVLERTRGSIIDRFVVTNVLVCDDMDSYSLIEPHIQVKIKPVRKTDKSPNAVKIGSISADRVYINSTDNSTNISVTTSQDNSKFDELKNTVAQLSDNDVELLKMIDELKAKAGSKDYSSKYQQFMAIAANHVTVWQGITPFIGWLAGLIK